jgi:dipeptidyl aminopeptidase/acylaminoacyl peptidase
LAYVEEGALWLVSTSGAGPLAGPRKIADGAYPVWAPDARRLAFICSEAGRAQICTYELDGMAVQQVTSFAAGVDADPFSAWLPNDDGPIGHRWSPDSKRIVFVSQTEQSSQRDANEIADEPREGAPLILTPTTPSEWTLHGVFAQGSLVPGWAPEGTHDPERGTDGRPRLPPVKNSHLYVVDVRSRTVQQITAGNEVNFDPDWAPDGRSIVFATSTRALREGPLATKIIRVVDLKSRDIVAVTKGAGDRRRPRWSPDGNWIAYLGGTNTGSNFISVVSRDGKKERTLTTDDQQPYGYEWVGPASNLAINYLEDVVLKIATFDGGNGFSPAVAVEAGVNLYLSASKSGFLAWQHSDGRVDGSVRMQAVSQGNSRVLLTLNPQIEAWPLAEQRVVRWKNSAGVERAGILLVPARHTESGRHPLIVDGYPQQLNGFKGYALSGNQAWASRGYAIFFPNPRAPHFSGYAASGDRHSSIGGSAWDRTLDDIESGIDMLVSAGIADPERVALFGFSNGGGVANYMFTKSRRFRCAASIAGVLPDWSLSVFLSSQSPVPEIAGGALPWSSPEEYAKLSAVYQVSPSGPPMLLAVGDDDGSETVLGNIEFYNALRRAGTNVTLLRYPKQGHELSGAALEDYWGRSLTFFADCLSPDGRFSMKAR